MENLPEKPDKPLDLDCCGNGCVPCVLDLYAEELAIWERECAHVTSGQHSARLEHTAAPEDYVGPELSVGVYRQYQIQSVSQETGDTRRFTCRLGHNQCLGLLPGQHVVIRGCSEGRSITRQYTPVSDVTLKGSFQLLIKVYKLGRMSQLVKRWEVGDWLDIRGPFGSLQYIPNQYSRVVMLAGGTGVAPMAQLIQAHLANEGEEGRVRLLYACRSYRDVLMKGHMAEWRRFWNFSAAFVLSQEPASSASSASCYQYGEDVIHGRIDKALLTTELGDAFQGTRVLICGPRSFDADMLKILDECSFPGEHVFRF
ncbi:hypothetical protein ACOMHN_039109 [Nucella lapillus]